VLIVDDMNENESNVVMMMMGQLDPDERMKVIEITTLTSRIHLSSTLMIFLFSLSMMMTTFH
jgi:hypothetical protein